MRLFPLLILALIAPLAQAADEPVAKPVKKAARPNPASALPESVAGVPDEQLAKIRRALMATYGDEAVAAARKRLADLKERTRFAKGRNEAEDLRLDFETARDAMVKATIEAVQKKDPSIEKDPLVLTLNAIEELVKKRGQEAAKAAQAKASEAERAAAANKPKEEAKPAAEPAAKEANAKPMTPSELLADVEGVSAEDMRKFRVAAFKAQRDPKVKELKAKRTQLGKEAEFLSQEEKKNLRGEFEQLQSDLRKANLAAIAQAAPDLSKETIDKVFEAMETRAREAVEKSGKKKAAKTPLKPFPFGEKK